MKKVGKILLCLLSVCMITGCGKKEIKTSGDFVSLAESKSFTVTDCTDQYGEYDYIMDVQVAIASEGEYQVEFYTISSDDYAKSFFDKNKEIMDESASGSSSHVSTESSSQQYYEASSDGQYYCLSRVGSTVFYAVVDKEYKDKVQGFVEELGY